MSSTGIYLDGNLITDVAKVSVKDGTVTRYLRDKHGAFLTDDKGFNLTETLRGNVVINNHAPSTTPSHRRA